MEKRIILNNLETPFWIEDTGRLRNERTKTWLKGGINKGYHFYSLYFKGKQYTLYTHRLVAEYFINNPDNLSIVHHKDGNKLNNMVLNLEWVDEEKHGQEHRGNSANLGRKFLKIEDEEILEQDLKQFRDSPYYVSRQGEVYNLSKKIKMKPSKSGQYDRVQCYYNLKGKKFQVHRMVWESFNGVIPDGFEINHIDSNPHNNALENLELVTHVENCQKANHKNIKVYSINANTGEKKTYSSIGLASLDVLGYRDGRKIPQVIASHELFKDCYWYYGE